MRRLLDRSVWIKKEATRRSRTFPRFLGTPAAVFVAILMTLAGLAGAVVASRNGEWVDVVVRLALATAVAGWAVSTGGRRHEHLR